MIAASAPAPADPRRSRRLWLLASRPATLPVSISPVLVGVATAAHDHRVHAAVSLLALVVAIALQVGVNYANDYSDFRRGADNAARQGPPRASSSGLVPPRTVLLTAAVAFSAAAAAGLAVALLSQAWLIGVGAACIAAAWLYTGGPRPYGYAGFGEVFVFVFFGLVATCGTVYVNEGRVTPLAVLGGAAMGCFAAAVLLLNNIRDISTDAAAGKRTLAVRAGRAVAQQLLLALLVAPYLIGVATVLGGGAPPLVLLPLLTLALIVEPLRASARNAAGPLIRALLGTVRAMALFAALWALALALS